MLLTTTIFSYLTNLFKKVEEPGTYGSSLERYIVSKNPQSTYDVEYWTRQFDEKISNKQTAEWPL